AVQTFKQRRANEKFANEVKKVRTGEKQKVKKEPTQRSINLPKWMIVLLVFLLVGGGVLELLRIFF
ncbi:Protein tam14, partial [Pichia kudriavzevii]